MAELRAEAEKRGFGGRFMGALGRIGCSLAALAAAASWAGPARAQPDEPAPATTLTLQEAIDRARANHPDVRAAQQGVRAAKFGLRSARAHPNPAVSIEPFLSQPPVDGTRPV